MMQDVRVAVPVVRRRSATMSGKAARAGTLLVQAPHRQGIVSSLAQVLNDHGATLLDSSHFSDPAAGMFFQRVQFDLATLLGERVALEADLRRLAEAYEMGWRVWYGDRARRVAIFTSKEEHCLYDLLIRHRAGELACQIAM